MQPNPILTNALRIFDLAESMDPDARDKAYRECHRLIQSQMSGTEWSDDAPPSALLELDGDLVSAALAVQEARLIRVSMDPHHHDMARLCILALLGDDAADAERETREQNAATIARLELGLHPTDERWL